MGDIIRFKKGLKDNLPILGIGEPGFTTNVDDQRLYLGGPNGNVAIPNMEDIDIINSQMNAIGQKIKTRHFKPVFGINAYWGETTGNLGATYNKTREGIQTDLNNWVELGVDEIIVPIHIGYDTNKNALYIVEKLDDIAWAIAQCESLNIKITTIKVHIQKINKDYIINTITWNIFETQYKNLLTQIVEKFLNTTVEIITVLNETEFIYTDTTYESFALECLDIAKNNGYKTGVTVAGWLNSLSVLKSILTKSDLICCNVYAYISSKLENTTIEDSIDAWETNGVDKWIEKMKENYPAKEIIISESGVQDYWRALSSPSTAVWDDADKVVTNGKAPEIYLQGLLKTLNRNDLSRVWWWYDLYFSNIKEILNYELKGVVNNG